VAFLTRLGEGLIPDENTVLQDGDLIHVMVRDDALAKVEATLGKSPEA
jgi:trk system potassium uptake protein TrkA